MSLNRREFLKFSAGVSAAASSLSGGALQGAANGGEKHVHSFCEMCSSRCPIEAKVVDGKVRFLSGNPKAGARQPLFVQEAAQDLVSSMMKIGSKSR